LIDQVQLRSVAADAQMRDTGRVPHLSHISITAKDADRLAAFYRDVFCCTIKRPKRRLSGDAISRGNGLPGCAITSIWLCLPETDQPFLELLEYREGPTSATPAVNAPGLGHLCFVTEDLEDTMRAVIAHGGSPVGEVTQLGKAPDGCLAIYMRDCEGNVLELEQPLR